MHLIGLFQNVKPITELKESTKAETNSKGFKHDLQVMKTENKINFELPVPPSIAVPKKEKIVATNAPSVVVGQQVPTTNIESLDLKIK